MKCALVVLLLACLAAASYGFVCPNGFCKDADCSYAPTKESCKGSLVENGSFCGCCNTCVEYIPVGGRCTVLVELGDGLLAKGICEPGHVCVNNVCVADSIVNHS